MNKHTVDSMTTAALRDLDPAPATVLTDAELERADATFARILATPSHHHVPEGPIGRAHAAVSSWWAWSAPPAPLSPHYCWGAAPLSCRGPRSPSHSRPRPRPKPPARAVLSSRCPIRESGSSARTDVADGPTCSSPAPRQKGPV